MRMHSVVPERRHNYAHKGATNWGLPKSKTQQATEEKGRKREKGLGIRDKDNDKDKDKAKGRAKDRNWENPAWESLNDAIESGSRTTQLIFLVSTRNIIINALRKIIL